MSTQWRKVLVDLWSNKTRTILVVLSIAVGVFAVGFVTDTFIIILGNMNADYESANAHSSFIVADSRFDDAFIKSLGQVKGVGEIEGRSALQGRIGVGEGKKATLLVTAYQDFTNQKMDIIRPNTINGKGTLPPLADKEIYLERSSQSALNLKPGDILPVELEDGTIRDLKVADFVYDITSAPFIFANMATGYVNPTTMEWLGGKRDFNTVYIVVDKNKMDEDYVKKVTSDVSDKIEKDGREVLFKLVMRPGRHWATDITQALAMLMGFLGSLAVLLSAFLVINTISALLTQHVRQIGIMKAIGGRTNQLIAMYVLMVLCFGILALIPAVPLSAILGYMTAKPIAGLLNFNVGEFTIPPVSIVLQISVALLFPMLAALVPVLNGVRVSIREAVSDYGIGQGTLGRSFIDRLLEKIHGVSRPLLISLRNTFRRKGRLALTLFTLTLGGAIFIGVFNVRSAITVAVDKTMGYFLSDVNVSFDKPHRIQQLEPITMSVPGVKSVEGWGFASAQLLSADKQTGTDIYVIAPPAKSKLVQSVMTRGRWVAPEDDRALVIGNSMAKLRPDLNPGDDVILKINGQESTWKIVGEYQMAGNMMAPLLYANYEALANETHQMDQFSSLRIVTDKHDLATQDRVIKDLEAKFEKAGIRVESMDAGEQLKEQQRTSIDVLILFLLVMAILIAIVGGLGLAGTMSMNVMERTREIGVMRSTGAADGMILQLVIVEGMLIGMISWVLGIILAFPITMILDNVVGSALVNSPLKMVLSLEGFIIWLVFVLVLSSLASALPARNASRLTIREILAYE
jgi:putative ABC transport system permease protein